MGNWTTTTSDTSTYISYFDKEYLDHIRSKENKERLDKKMENERRMKELFLFQGKVKQSIRDTSLVMEMIKDVSDVNFVLQYAISARNLDLVKILVEQRGCDINRYSVYFMSSDADIIKYYLNRVGSLNGGLFQTMLETCSVRKFSIDVTNDLIRIIISRNIMSSIVISKVLINLNMLDVFKDFLGGDEYVISSNDVLSYIIEHNCFDFFKFFVDKGVNVNYRVVEYVLRAHNDRMFVYLLEKGKINRENISNYLHDYICARNDQNDNLVYLLGVIDFSPEELKNMMKSACLTRASLNISVIARNNPGLINEFLKISCEFCQPDIVESLIRLGADINHEDGVCLYLASINSNIRVVNYLIGLGCKYVTPLEKEYLSRVEIDDPYDPRIDNILFPIIVKKKTCNKKKAEKKKRKAVPDYSWVTTTEEARDLGLLPQRNRVMGRVENVV